MRENRDDNDFVGFISEHREDYKPPTHLSGWSSSRQPLKKSLDERVKEFAAGCAILSAFPIAVYAAWSTASAVSESIGDGWATVVAIIAFIIVALPVAFLALCVYYFIATAIVNLSLRGWHYFKSDANTKRADFKTVAPAVSQFVKSHQKACLIVVGCLFVLVLAFIIASANRYTIVVAGNNIAYRVDRWTGKTHVLRGYSIQLMEEK